jgi:acetylornithine aminotransferase/acetylornithine/N-succinyldiaminopimelate aminotransferase
MARNISTCTAAMLFAPQATHIRRWVKAIQEQAERVLFYSNLVYSEIRAKAAEKLVSVAPESLTKAFFCNSGTEANENAMRMARMATGREKIVTFSGGFHGRTADSISATFLGKYRDIGKPNVPGHVAAEFGNIESVRAVADQDAAAIMLEPIQSMAGVREAPPEFFRELRQLCDEQGIILIFDEVQTGIGRTGNWFFGGSDLADLVEPDIISLAKSLGSGIPVGACLVNEKVSAHIKENDLGTTFGGGMLAMAAVVATLEAIEQDNMIVNARNVEQHLRDSLAGAKGVVAIHGKGCLLGIEFEEACGPFIRSCLRIRSSPEHRATRRSCGFYHRCAFLWTRSICLARHCRDAFFKNIGLRQGGSGRFPGRCFDDQKRRRFFETPYREIGGACFF